MGRRPLHILFVRCGGAHSSPVGKGARQVNHRERGLHRDKPLRVYEKEEGRPGGGWRPKHRITTTGERDEGSLECVIRQHLWLMRTARPIGSNPDLSRCKTLVVAVKDRGGGALQGPPIHQPSRLGQGGASRSLQIATSELSTPLGEPKRSHHARPPSYAST